LKSRKAYGLPFRIGLNYKTIQAREPSLCVAQLQAKRRERDARHRKRFAMAGKSNAKSRVEVGPRVEGAAAAQSS
jgi:hypothetical protein